MPILQRMRRRILFTVLDWGLGHATRSIPIIRALLASGCEVVIASDSMALEFLRAEFPHLPAYALPPYNVKYTSDRVMINAARNWSNIMKAMRSEHDEIEGILMKEKITAIISDNRYGCYRRGIPSVLITHQLKFRTGNVLLDKIPEVLVKQWTMPFDRIWVPDDEERTLSGDLARSNDPRVRCIGWQSTLSSAQVSGRYRVAAILSGPEPQRTYLENEIRPQLLDLDAPSVLVRGVRGFDEPRQSGNLSVYDFLDRQRIDRLISQTQVVICRTGYSSLMDLQSVGKKALLIPTPGQPEQVYLGEHMQKLPNYQVQEQGSVDISAALGELDNVATPEAAPTNALNLHEAMIDFFAMVETHDVV